MKKIIRFNSLEEAFKQWPHACIPVIQNDNGKFIIELEIKVCDKCGLHLTTMWGRDIEGLSLDIHWGYESNKDLERHMLDLCEKCYDEHILPLVQQYGYIKDYV